MQCILQTEGVFDINTDNIIQFNNISIEYKMKDFSIRAVNKVTLPIVKGKITAIVGESGSGKTTLVSSILRNISSPGEVVEGEVLFKRSENDEFDVLQLKKNELQQYRWKDASMVFQASQSTLNPTMKIGEQFYETAYYHGCKKSYKEYLPHIEELLEYVKLDPKRVADSYPHELSGGMKQRVMIAFALLLDPQVIILDEPTTALDVITQYYIFEILSEINKTKGITMILLTHDIGIVARAADYVAVMYAGKLMEYGTVYEVFDQHLHPYAQGLINATPSIIADISKMKAIGGEAPNLLALPKGCAFSPRCSECRERCKMEEPNTYTVSDGHQVRCFKYEENTNVAEPGEH